MCPSLINPPIYAFGPYSSLPGYGPVGYGFGPTYGYGTAYTPGYYVDPINNQALQQQYNNDWTILSARMADLAKVSPVKKYPLETLRLLNDLYPDKEPKPGQLLKIIE